ncbi:GNAT family N-acetyltransferase [Paraburkholderia sp. Se-20369]|nr:GNAT family N-acetyltransferase [Paraburkholderia sp. Se-20369]TCW87238.1 N-acetyltransferase [Burkholderia sp. SRS-46]
MPAVQITLRHATTGDAQTIARLHTLSWQRAYRHILPANYLEHDAPGAHLSKWRAYFARPEAEWGMVRIAEVNGVAIGFASAENVQDPRYGALLDCLHILADYQGYGAGRQLIEAARAWTREIGERTLHLFALEDNANAIAFYERYGWQFAGTEASTIGETPVVDRRYVLAA